jgi:hypothetical protein
MLLDRYESDPEFCIQFSSLASVESVLAHLSSTPASRNDSQPTAYKRFLDDLPRIVRNEILPIKKDIKKEFRELLGS